MPALIVSTAAGIIVSKAGVAGKTEKALFGQLGGNPKALGMSAGLLLVLALLPGMPAAAVPAASPAAPAASPGSLTGAAARRDRRSAAAKRRQAQAAPPAEEPISTALRIDDLRLELGYGLLSLVKAAVEGPRLTDQIKALRRQLAAELGFVMPSVRIQDNMQLPANSYVIRVKEIEAGRGEVRPVMLLVMDPRGEPIALPGEKTNEPTFGLPALWIEPAHREEALFRGLTVVDPATVVTTHLTEVVKDHMATCCPTPRPGSCSTSSTRTTRSWSPTWCPRQISYGGVQRVLQNLLDRAHLDPRSADHPRGHRRGMRAHPQRHPDHRARAGPAGPADQRHVHQRQRLHPAADPGAGMGADLRRVAAGRRRRSPAGDPAQQAAAVRRRRSARPTTARLRPASRRSC